MNTFLNNLVDRLPAGVRPYAKALVPLAVFASGAAVDLSLSGEELRALAELGGGAVTSVLVLLIPNREAE